MKFKENDILIHKYFNEKVRVLQPKFNKYYLCVDIKEVKIIIYENQLIKDEYNDNVLGPIN